ncbi:hypothetical protein PoB_004886800 [Plakobranchus ocellatus]|uniref:Uncharacterized protein n=1 Tax=Plakobranchus ocellatus TaxID=259542 RepID=A0AAV4BU80_9GAST|nr:hypothetical protein PoB_004886800 [Plakobranchus ocellatus]
MSAHSQRPIQFAFKLRQYVRALTTTNTVRIQTAPICLPTHNHQYSSHSNSTNMSAHSQPPVQFAFKLYQNVCPLTTTSTVRIQTPPICPRTQNYK